jgi:hypothetical protein
MGSRTRGPIHRPALAAATAALLCVAGGGAAQAPGGFDLSSLEIPPGFLDVADLVLTTGSDGDIVAMGTTILGNARAHLLLAVDPARGIRNGLTLGLKPEAWSLTENIPALSNPLLDGIDFSNVGLILASADRDADSWELSHEEWAFYREIYASDEFRLTLRPGVNLVAAIPAEDLGPDHPLTLVMDALGIEKGVVLIQGGLGQSLGLLNGGGGASAIRDLYLRAELPPMRPPGSPEWFHGGQLALELTGDPSVRVVGEMTVAIQEDVLVFFVAASLARSGMSLAGGLMAEEGWQQPFGIPWLILNKVVLQVGITPTGSIQPGFAANMVVGEKDIDVAVAMAISPAGVPTSFMISGASETGFGFSDLVEVQSGMAAARDAAAGTLGADGPPRIPLDALPDMDLRGVALKFAPADVPELDVERGFRVAGMLWLPLSADGELTEFAGVDVSVSDDGILAAGQLGAFELGPLVWQDALLDLAATRQEQHLMVSGAVELFGSSQLVDLSLTREEFSFRSETNMFDMFTADITASSVFNLRRPDFQLHAIARADFGNAVGPMAQDAIILFAQQGENVVAATAAANRAASEAVANTQATVDELRRVLETQRALAESALASARSVSRSAKSRMDAAWSSRNRALRTYNATSWYPASTKASRLRAYQSAHRQYLVLAVRYKATVAVVTANQRLLAAIPPVNQNILLMTADEALRELRAQLAATQAALDQMETQFAAINGALARGEQLLVIDRAEFRGGLQSAMNGEALRWDLVGRFVGEPFEISQTMDFSNPGEGAAQMIQALMNL